MSEICTKCGGVRNASFTTRTVSIPAWTGQPTDEYAQPFAGATILLCGCAPSPHDGNLDTYPLENGHAEVWLTNEGMGLHVHGTKRDTYLDASQAISLHAYLMQELDTLKRLERSRSDE